MTSLNLRHIRNRRVERNSKEGPKSVFAQQTERFSAMCTLGLDTILLSMAHCKDQISWIFARFAGELPTSNCASR